MIILHQFPYSHFNEKARWALDYKEIEHSRRGYLPGPHVPAMKKLSGRSQTPVLEWDDTIVAGSADIIDYIEARVAAPALFPADAEARNRAKTICEQFDSDLGPATRSLIFSGLIRQPAYTADMFSSGKSPLTRMLYRWTFPLVKPVIAKANGVNPDNLKKARQITSRSLDEIAELTSETGYIIGNSFTVADLTAAALLAPIASVSHPDMARPKPVPGAVQSVIDEFSAHPTVTWVNGIYEKHRGGA